VITSRRKTAASVERRGMYVKLWSETVTCPVLKQLRDLMLRGMSEHKIYAMKVRGRTGVQRFIVSISTPMKFTDRLHTSAAVVLWRSPWIRDWRAPGPRRVQRQSETFGAEGIFTKFDVNFVPLKAIKISYLWYPSDGSSSMQTSEVCVQLALVDAWSWIGAR
jgi:hypothetical protein